MTLHAACEADEELRWEGKPAPRCYTFRHWRHSLFGLLFLFLCGFWEGMALPVSTTYQATWVLWLPVPFLLIGLYFSAGHLLQARLEWNHVHYGLTNRRLLVQRGLVKVRICAVDLNRLTFFRLYPQGEQLGTLHLYGGRERLMVLHCLEYPRRLTDLLAETIRENQEPINAEDRHPR
jgi:hypothetical protein